MVDQVDQEYNKMIDAFVEMRREMRNNQQYSGKSGARDKLYEAIRQFAYEVGLTPPCIPVDPDPDDHRS
jgi:hypothetical protein